MKPIRTSQKSRITGLGLVALIATSNMVAFAQSTNVLGPIDLSTVRTIAARNIFNQNRYPQAQNTRRNTQPQRQPDYFALVGTMSYEKGDFAFFDGSSSQFRKVVPIDGSIANFTVVDIAADSVILETDTNIIELRMGVPMRDQDGRWTLNGNQSSASTSSPSYSRSSTGASNSRNRYSYRRRGNGGNFGSFNGGRRAEQAPLPEPATESAPPEQTEPGAVEGNNASPVDEIISPGQIMIPDDSDSSDGAAVPFVVAPGVAPVPENPESNNSSE